MFHHLTKLAGPLKHSTVNSDRVILTCDRRLWWPALLALSSLALLLGSFRVPALWLFLPFFGVPGIIGGIYFAVFRPDVVLSEKDSMLEVRPRIPWLRASKAFHLPFSKIQEFLVEPEFDIGIGKPSGFVWHLIAITVDGEQHRLTWHFAHDPVLLAGQEAACISKKALREASDPLKSRTWSRWGSNFLR